MTEYIENNIITWCFVLLPFIPCFAFAWYTAKKEEIVLGDAITAGLIVLVYTFIFAFTAELLKILI